MTRVKGASEKSFVDEAPILGLHEGMIERPHTLTVRLSAEESAQIHALAEDADASVGRIVRAWLAREYLKRFGAEPAPVPKLRPGRRRTSRPAITKKSDTARRASGSAKR